MSGFFGSERAPTGNVKSATVSRLLSKLSKVNTTEGGASGGDGGRGKDNRLTELGGKEFVVRRRFLAEDVVSSFGFTLTDDNEITAVAEGSLASHAEPEALPSSHVVLYVNSKLVTDNGTLYSECSKTHDVTMVLFDAASMHELAARFLDEPETPNFAELLQTTQRYSFLDVKHPMNLVWQRRFGKAKLVKETFTSVEHGIEDERRVAEERRVLKEAAEADALLQDVLGGGDGGKANSPPQDQQPVVVSTRQIGKTSPAPEGSSAALASGSAHSIFGGKKKRGARIGDEEDDNDDDDDDEEEADGKFLTTAVLAGGAPDTGGGQAAPTAQDDSAGLLALIAGAVVPEIAPPIEMAPPSYKSPTLNPVKPPPLPPRTPPPAESGGEGHQPRGHVERQGEGQEGEDQEAEVIPCKAWNRGGAPGVPRGQVPSYLKIRPDLPKAVKCQHCGAIGQHWSAACPQGGRLEKAMERARRRRTTNVKVWRGQESGERKVCENFLQGQCRDLQCELYHDYEARDRLERGQRNPGQGGSDGNSPRSRSPLSRSVSPRSYRRRSYDSYSDYSDDDGYRRRRSNSPRRGGGGNGGRQPGRGNYSSGGGGGGGGGNKARHRRPPMDDNRRNNKPRR